jgi:NAD(P)-dependent dehydrogenase (short-subunit alcohol dehydrogenase family)
VASIRARGGEVIGRVTDIGSAPQARILVQWVMRRYGRLDVLINNAGILGPRVSIIDYPTRDWNQVLRINLSGTFYVSRAAAEIMLSQRSGTIITLSSSVGRTGRGRWGAYAVSKFGVEGLSQVMADEFRERGISAVTFNPGGTRTAMRAAAYPSEDPATVRDPDAVARALWQLANTCSPAASGRALDFDDLP